MSPRRRGISLVEMLVVIGLSSLILSLIATCLHGLYRADGRTRLRLEERAAITQLSLRLRADAHAAVHAELLTPSTPDELAGLALIAADGRRIEYRSATRRIERTVSQDGRTIHRDAFRLPLAQATWELETAMGRSLVAVVLTTSALGSSAAVRAAAERLEAAVGLHSTLTPGEQP